MPNRTATASCATSAATASAAEQVIELPRAVPVYLTYLTVEMKGGILSFRPDPYAFDELAMPQMQFGARDEVALAF